MSDAPPTCPNCGSLRVARFCGQCGQNNRFERVGLRSVFAELADVFANIDSRM